MSMNAERKFEILSAYHDGELTGEERAAAERLLEESVEAREALEDMAEVSDAVRSLPRPRAPEALRADVMERVVRLRPAAAGKPRHTSRRVWIYSAATAATALVAAALYQLSQPDAQLGALVADNRVSFTPAESPRPMRDAAAGPMFDTAVDAPGVESARFPLPSASTAVADSTGADLDGDALRSWLQSLERVPTEGELLARIETNQDQPVLVEYLVVDVGLALDQVQVLLAQNGIQSLNQDLQPSEAAEGSRGRSMVIYVDAPQEQMLTALNDVDRQLKNVVAVNSNADVATWLNVERKQLTPRLAGARASPIVPPVAEPQAQQPTPPKPSPASPGSLPAPASSGVRPENQRAPGESRTESGSVPQDKRVDATRETEGPPPPPPATRVARDNALQYALPVTGEFQRRMATAPRQTVGNNIPQRSAPAPLDRADADARANAPIPAPRAQILILLHQPGVAEAKPD
jgi:hypothetical protein